MKKNTDKPSKQKRIRISYIFIKLLLVIFIVMILFVIFKMPLEQVASEKNKDSGHAYQSLEAQYEKSSKDCNCKSESITDCHQHDQSLKTWSSISIKYYRGLDISADLDDFKNKKISSSAKELINKLSEQIKIFGPYRPVHIYTEFLQLQNACIEEFSRIKCNGFICRFLTRLFSVHKKPPQSNVVNQLVNIQGLVESQNYRAAQKEIVAMQKKYKCIKNFGFDQIERQERINGLFNDVSREITPIHSN